MNRDKEQKAIERLKSFEPETEPYYLCYSGGKDSDTIKILAELSGVKFEAVHNLTSVDMPETVKYIKSQNDVKIHIPRNKDGKHITMWDLIIKKHFPPTRVVRYCCSELKEQGGKGRLKITGVRADESSKRKANAGMVKVIGKPKTMQKKAEEMQLDYEVNNKNGLVLNYDNADTRRFVEHCYRTTSTIVNPIIDWSESDVWEFLNHYGCKSNPLYECGNKRIGCIGCPMAGKQRRQELKRYPTYYRAYLRAFDKMLQARKESGLDGVWQSAEDVMKWWLE